MRQLLTLIIITFSSQLLAQDYFYKKLEPFDPAIPSPEQFLGYPIGEHHTRHDRIVAYLQKLADVSDKANIITYGMTHEYRPLVILNISSPENLNNLSKHQADHMALVDPNNAKTASEDMPIFINLGYNVHGNEPSSSEAALLTAYTLVASQSAAVKEYLNKSIIFIDPTINPDGRDRHTHWANMYKGSPKVKDPADAEHNEAWPRGRTNHYWFDLNRDWLLAINPESRGKLKWFHEWYPNVVTDFHEMGTNSTYFFEPMKPIASKDPIMPKENYTKLNDLFAKYFEEDLNKIGSLYFTKEAFDGTYPGYGSSYPDLQGGLALLFEQASSRGHVQETPMGDITFAFTIRNQYTSSMATVRAAVENKGMLMNYQKDFFKSAISNANKSSVKGYVFGDPYDENRTRAFIDKLLLHKVKVHKLSADVTRNGKVFKTDYSYVVPAAQPQYRMVQTMFETYSQYSDSVYYDASAWSVANFYNMPYAPLTGSLSLGSEVTAENNVKEVAAVESSNYAYLLSWEDYNAPAALYYLQDHDVRATSAFKPFSINVASSAKSFNYGTIMIPISKQKISKDSLNILLKAVTDKYKVDIYPVATGYSSSGIDLGSSNFETVQKPKAVMLVEGSVSSYEAGEVWHLLDTRVDMPITKVPMRNFGGLDLNDYNTLVMVSGRYNDLDSADKAKITSWVSSGNTLITIRTATSWAISSKLVKEKLVEKDKDKKEEDKVPVKSKPYVDAGPNIGKQEVGGAIFEVSLDLTHPLAFGYRSNKMPVYRNSDVWLAPSASAYGTVARYTDNPHIDGFITPKNLNENLKGSASLIVSGVGRGRVVMFADNPNFRGSWYGTNRLFLNALFLGNHISVPKE
ncbi:M14 family zinc carboxypeptidase [Fulvivirga sp.]|uniref:M14 family zinc carboxypeptidase n=1 Tax=Fulvivirga sp. TaxID=1931237 RepID=UPI0032EE3AA5